MNTVQKILGALVLASATHPAHAALWSVGNEVVRAGSKTTITLSLTGDGVTHGTNVDLTIPRGFQAIGARSLNGGQCAVLPNPNPPVTPDVVRAIQVAPYGPIATRATAICEVSVVANQTFSDWFRLAADECYDGAALRVPCVLDPGYVTVLP